jgi:predicted alpha-1,6-mannanase (GH76 family)
VATCDAAPVATDWTARADAAQRSLIVNFARPLGLPWIARLHSPAGLHDRITAMYWWQAHYLDALLDAQERAPTAARQRRIGRLIAGQWLANFGRLRRSYNDDMGWMALALLRAGRRSDAERLWGLIRSGWNDRHGGGICWRTEQPGYKNLPANGPAAILAARLGQHQWAERIVDWMESILIDTGTGEVIDGIDRLGDGGVDAGWRFSYDYGLAMLAELLVGRRQIAERIAAAGIAHCAPNGVPQGELHGDGALFKGIFVRYLALLGTPDADATVLATAQAYWSARDGRGRFGPDPLAPPQPPVELSAMLSGVFAIEAAGRVASRGGID